MEMFQFKGFSPTAAIREKANRLLARIQIEAPSESKATAQLVWDGEKYTCSICLQSRLYPLLVSANHWNAGIAIDKTEFILARKLEKRGVRLTTREISSERRSWNAMAAAWKTRAASSPGKRA